MVVNKKRSILSFILLSTTTQIRNLRIVSEKFRVITRGNYIQAVLILAMFILFGPAKAVVVADFGASDTVGCAPLTVTFHDSSSSNVTYRKWIFGNGNSSTGNALNPSTIYTAPGYYDVTLIVSDGFDTATITKISYIQSLAKPVAAFFNQPTVIGCAAFDFQVYDNSTYTDAAINSWVWDFDDGTPPVSAQNPFHTYANAGSYSVTLIVTDSMGCTNSSTFTNLVTVQPTPMANYTSYIPTSACGAPLPINLVNTSTGTPPLVYQWTVGSNSYSSTNVVDTLQQVGGYDVQLIATNSLGCADTLLLPNYIWIGTIQASMNIPDTACLGDSIDFFNTSGGGSSFFWNFGDGSTGNGMHTKHAYLSPGWYTVTLVASSSATCIDTVTQNIFIENIQAGFTSTPNFACSSPLIVNFTDQSVGNVVSWEWHFGSIIPSSNDTSSLQNPTHAYTYQGIYDDTLIVTSASGCKSMIIKPANEEIFITQANFITNNSTGCAPLLVNFNNITSPYDSVDYVEWDYMDGSPLDTNYSPSHTFYTSGDYDVTLTVYSVSGCATSYTITISVGSPQTANFSIDTTISCASNLITFTNLSYDTNLINSYVWDFGDSTMSTDFEPEHHFADTGYMSITLITFYNGCPDTLVIDSAIQILGPLITYTPTLDCDTPNHYFFNPSTRGGTSFLWNFGDSTALDSVNIAVDHYYPPFDSNYTASFWAYDSITGCSFTKKANIKVRYLVGALSVNDTNACFGQTIHLNTYNSVNAVANVDWSLNDSTTYTAGITDESYSMGTMGDNYIYAIVYDINGCADTLNRLVRVWKPDAQFGAPITQGCAPVNIQFLDSSTSDTNIVAWNWKFGDGNTSNVQNPSHIFNGNGDTYFDITLTVTDTFGCKSTLKRIDYIYAIEPPSYFQAIHRLSCDNDTTYFYDAPVGNYTYLWDFGDGTSSTLIQDQHTYPTGNYNIKLTVTDVFGCDSTYVRNNYVKVQDYPTANFTASPLSTFCYPSSITFTDSSTYTGSVDWHWNFGDSPNWVYAQTSPVQNLYTAPGFYDVSMVVTTSHGCSDTIVKPNMIDIGGPTANILIDPIIGCANQIVDFDADNTNVDAQVFVWDFGDGTLDTTDAVNTMLTHQYPLPGTYSIVLLYSDSLGLCQKTDQVDLIIDDVIANFKPTKEQGCIPLNMALLNLSIGADSYGWYLDNGFNSSATNPAMMISTPGFHDVQLIAWSSISQCADTIVKKIEVFPLPNVKASPDVTVCIGDETQLSVTGASFYSWTPSTYLDYDNSPTPISTPLKDTKYVVIGTDSNNCKNTDTINVKVQKEPEILWFPTDTSIFSGGEFQINTLSNIPIIYNWSPATFLSCSDCQDPVAFPTAPTNFVLTYSDENYCFTYDTSFYVNVEEEFTVYIPNAFTPNWDGDNDTFKPVTYGIKELVFMRIFDRWGNMVFETADLNQGWDGRLKGEIVAHNSIFTYTIQLRRFNDEVLNYTGKVLLISK